MDGFEIIFRSNGCSGAPLFLLRSCFGASIAEFLLARRRRSTEPRQALPGFYMPAQDSRCYSRRLTKGRDSTGGALGSSMHCSFVGCFFYRSPSCAVYAIQTPSSTYLS